jgi:hypothetical protein
VVGEAGIAKLLYMTPNIMITTKKTKTKENEANKRQNEGETEKLKK